MNEDAGAMELAQPTCPVCGSEHRRAKGRRGDRTIPEILNGAVPTRSVGVFACRDCDHLWCDPIPVDPAAYDEAATTYFRGSDETRSAAARRTMDRLGRHRPPPGRLLDIGCGRGYLLEVAARDGWHVEGIEPTAAFAAVAARHGAVHHGYLDARFHAEPFDAICMMAVLEHVPDPVALLREARRLAKPGAVLYVNVPNWKRPEATLLDLTLRVRRLPWTVRTSPMQTPFHLAEFSTRSLEVALRRAGWAPVQRWVATGRNEYPVPRPVRLALRAIQRGGTMFGRALNLDVIAVA